MIAVAELVVYASALYVVIGVAVAIGLVTRGVTAFDHNARGTSPGFRLAIFPGCVAFWPLLLARWRARSRAPEESNAHRDLVKEGARR